MANASFLDVLPIEVVESIVCLMDQDSPPPTAALLYEPPTSAIFDSAPDAACRSSNSFKSLSQTCRALRRLVTPKLFAHLKVRGEDIDRLELINVRKSGLSREPLESILLYIDPLQWPTIHLGDTDIKQLRAISASATWLVQTLNPRSFSLVAPPQCLGWLMDHPLNLGNCWVMALPLQMIRLEQGPVRPTRWFPHDTVHDNKTVSTVRPWNHCSYNEGSFASAYNTYDYHSYEAPSLHQDHSMPEMQCHALQLACLRSFELIAVFPFNHMDNTIYFLARLPNLQTLSVQLAPTLTSQRQDTINGTTAKCPSDFWLELETNYKLIRNALNCTLWCLSEYIVRDYESEGYRDLIDLAMAKVSEDWKSNDRGTWTRDVKCPVPNIAHTRRERTVCPSMQHDR